MSVQAWAAAGMMFTSSLSSYQDRRQAAAVTKRMTEFNNILGQLNNAMNSNALASQLTSANKQALQDRMNISASSMKYKAALDLQIASAKIGGNSVTLQENDIIRKADNAFVTNKEAEEAAIQNVYSQKENLDFSTIAGKDYTIVQEPNAFFALLGATTQGYQAYTQVSDRERYTRVQDKAPSKTTATERGNYAKSRY